MTSRRGANRRPKQAAGGDEIAGLAARMSAARLLAAVIDARTSLDGLTDNEHGHPQYRALDPRDRGLVRAILSTALRYRGTIGAMLSARLQRPLPGGATALSHILHVACAQILFLDVPDSAAVDLAVAHAKSDPRTARFAALVNAVLRETVRRKDVELALALASLSDAPDWFAERLVAGYGRTLADEILAMHRVETPVDFTVRGDAAFWAVQLGGSVLPTGSVRVERPAMPVPELPGFAEGQWWVQDAAAALPARLLRGIGGLRVADLCAAPGGKTAQLADAGARVTALDLSANRLARLAANLERLGIEADLVEADLRRYRPPVPFDAILLDAPCSSTGTVRRHPDVPWTKSPAEIEKLAALQRTLLDRAWGLLAPGGTLVFSNCSLDRAEGEHLIAAFLAETPDSRCDPVARDEIPGAEAFVTPEGHLRTTPAGFRFLRPESSGLDGFFAVRLKKAA